MKKLILIFFAVLFFSTAHAQTKPVMLGGAYYRIQTPGNLPVDDNGNPLRGADTVRMIYLFTSANIPDTPKITGVQYGNRVFSPSIFKERYQFVPRAKTAAGKKYNYWKIEVAPLDKFAAGKKGVIIITGTYRGKKFIISTAKEIQLEPELRG